MIDPNSRRPSLPDPLRSSAPSAPRPAAPRHGASPLSAPVRRHAPPSPSHGLWELPGGLGVPVFR
jgi:hypothetical protein